MGKSVMILSKTVDLNPGSGETAEGAAQSGQGAGGDGFSMLSLVPPAGALASGVEEFGKRGENLMKSTTPLKSTGKFKFYDNGWNGNQYVTTKNVFNKGAMKGVARVGFAAGVVLNGMEIYDGYKADGDKFGKNATKQTAGAVGGMGGAILGAKVGSLGGSVFPGLGTVIGGIAGAIAGAWGGEKVSEWAAEKAWWGDE